MFYRIRPTAIAQLGNTEDVAQALLPRAEQILAQARTRAPSWIDPAWLLWWGVGPQGSYAQAVARGSGTIAAEFGSSRSPAHAYLRSSI